jgi:hypothetical protein
MLHRHNKRVDMAATGRAAPSRCHQRCGAVRTTGSDSRRTCGTTSGQVMSQGKKTAWTRVPGTWPLPKTYRTGLRAKMTESTHFTPDQIEAIQDPTDKSAWESIGGSWIPSQVPLHEGPCAGKTMTINLDRMRWYYPMDGNDGITYCYDVEGHFNGLWVDPTAPPCERCNAPGGALHGD